MALELIKGHTCHTRFLNSQSYILDLGANYGEFSEGMISRLGCHCVAIEPNPKLFDKIKSSDKLEKKNLAITAVSKPVEFHLSRVLVSSSVKHKSTKNFEQTITIDGKNLEDLVTDLGNPKIDLIKMDIEGVEIDVLQACSDNFLQSIGQFSIEFHDHCGYVSKEEIQKLVERFESLGFLFVNMFVNSHHDTWFINTRLCPISKVEYLYIRYFLRNWRGIKRRLKRWLKSSPLNSSKKLATP